MEPTVGGNEKEGGGQWEDCAEKTEPWWTQAPCFWVCPDSGQCGLFAPSSLLGHGSHGSPGDESPIVVVNACK
jgi:hypothetical protein